jgi:hypothetical protein
MSPLIRRSSALLGVLLLGAGIPVLRADAKPAPAVPTLAPAQPLVRAAKPGPVSPYASFDKFGILEERNIFNPNRIGRTARGATEVAAPTDDVITLVGTMDYEKGKFAFFDGTGAEFRKALPPGGSIAQYRVTRIDGTGADLVRDGKPVILKIGQQLRRPPGGDWIVVPLDTVRQEAAAQAAAAASAASDATAAPAIPADASEALRRLMEKRQKELKQ